MGADGSGVYMNLGVVPREGIVPRKSGGMNVQLVAKQRRVVRNDTTGTPAFTLGVVNLDQVSGRIRAIYGRWWGQLNGDSFYYPCKIPLPLAKVNPNITLIDERKDAIPMWDWADLAPRRRTVSKLKVLDNELSVSREGNPWNLRQHNEVLYYDGHTDSRVIKATKVDMVTSRIGITIPEGCLLMYRELCHGFPRGKARKYDVLYLHEAIQCLHYWRVPLTYATIANMGQYANGRDKLPGQDVVSKAIKLAGLVHVDTLATGAQVYNFATAPTMPQDLKDKYPHQRTGRFAPVPLSSLCS